jgi:hypothetical protein
VRRLSIARSLVGLTLALAAVAALGVASLYAARARVLVVGRAQLRGTVGRLLSRRGIDHAWATTGAEAARLCEERHFEVALVDAGMRSPQAALAQLDLRGRRLRRSVVVFPVGDDSPGLARLDPDPMPVEEATRRWSMRCGPPQSPKRSGSLPAGAGSGASR